MDDLFKSIFLIPSYMDLIYDMRWNIYAGINFLDIKGKYAN